MIIIAKPTGFHFDQLAFANSTSSTGIPLTADICRNKENDRFNAKSMAWKFLFIINKSPGKSQIFDVDKYYYFPTKIHKTNEFQL